MNGWFVSLLRGPHAAPGGGGRLSHRRGFVGPGVRDLLGLGRRGGVGWGGGGLGGGRGWVVVGPWGWERWGEGGGWEMVLGVGRLAGKAFFLGVGGLCQTQLAIFGFVPL